MDVSVIICTWNRSKMLAVALTSLEACIVPPAVEWEVLVVDNNSTDDTRSICESFVEKKPGRFRYLFEAKQGKTFALNAGIQHARGEILALTDDDVTVDPLWVAQVYEMFQRYDCAAVGGRIIPVWKCEKPSWIEFDGPFRHPAYGGIVNFDKGDAPCLLTATAVGANMGLRRTIFEKYGAYRTDLNSTKDLLRGEDTEYCLRLLHAEERLMYAPQAIVYHPVEEYRTKRSYIQSMAFHYGRWTVRIDGVPESTKCYFGVPRYLFPIAAKFLGKWLAAFRVKRRFFWKLEFFQTLGQMIESKRWLRNRQPQRSLGGVDPAK
jgi:glycosyltransferase involved in cell wall biosynthesis